MKKYIINLTSIINYPIKEISTYVVEKTSFNILDYGIEFNIEIDGKNRKFIIPWQQVRSIEEINT